MKFFLFKWWDCDGSAVRVMEKMNLIMKKIIAEHGFDPRTSGLWAQHASTAPLCYFTLRNISIIWNDAPG